MIRSAIEAMHNSYSPYSKFKVGASALLKDGTIIVGTNIENASYGLSMCAERVCLFNVYSKGYTKNDIVSMFTFIVDYPLRKRTNKKTRHKTALFFDDFIMFCQRPLFFLRCWIFSFQLFLV